MSTQYNGLAGSVATATPVNIASSTNANPIVLATSSAHGLTTGDTVDITGHQTNTTANGVARATVVDSTHFSIPVAGVGVGGATGQVQSLALGVTYSIPNDGDADAAVTVNVAFQTLGDRTAFLGQSTGYEKLAGRAVLFLSSLVGSSFASFTGTLTAATPTAMTLAALGVQGMEVGSLTVAATAGPFAVSGVVPTDIVRVKLSTSFLQTTTSNPRVLLYYAVTAPGASTPAFGAFSQVVGASAPSGNPASNVPTQMEIEGFIPHPSGGVLWLQPVLYSTAGGLTTCSLGFDSLLAIEAWRLTLMPQ